MTKLIIFTFCILLIPSVAFAASMPPSGWPSTFDANVTLTGVTEHEHFTWQSTAWRNDPEPTWDLILSPPDQLQAFVLIDLNSSDPNVALYLAEGGQFFVFDPANNIQGVKPSFEVPEPSSVFALLAVTTIIVTTHQRKGLK